MERELWFENDSKSEEDDSKSYVVVHIHHESNFDDRSDDRYDVITQMNHRHARQASSDVDFRDTRNYKIKHLGMEPYGRDKGIGSMPGGKWYWRYELDEKLEKAQRRRLEKAQQLLRKVDDDSKGWPQQN